MVEELKARRADIYKKQSKLERLGGKVLETYWLIQGAHVSLPLEAVKELSASDEVAYLELADGVAEPPADADPNNDLVDARAQIFSDPYFNLGQTSGWIGLLDTGVRETHTVFNGPDHIAIADDLTGDGDASDQCNHGTASAGEITAMPTSATTGAASRRSRSTRGTSTATTASWAPRTPSKASRRPSAGSTCVIVAEIQLNAGEAFSPRAPPPTPRSTPARS